ncbi:MAG TPA: ankyrin repeat domain-containing protein, partial [Turneriella sp.]|nr:ankyrin repeat domain-containing protein [Turneriella sp.]
MNDPAMKPADYSRALTYLCKAMGKFYMTNFEEDQKKYCIEVAEKLRAKGAQINTVNKQETALLSSIGQLQEVYFDYLMKNGADPNLANTDGETPLMKAVYKEPYAQRSFTKKTNERYFTESLLKAGAKINAKSKNGRTALHVVAYWGHSQAADFLIKKGAALEVKDKDGLTPMQVAQIENRNAVVSSLKSAGAKETPLPAKYLAARQKNAENQKMAQAEAEIAQAKENARKKSEANKAYEEQLKGLK